LACTKDVLENVIKETYTDLEVVLRTDVHDWGIKKIIFSTSHHPRSNFLRILRDIEVNLQPVEGGEWEHTITLPGSLLGSYVKIELCPEHQKAIRISMVSFRVAKTTSCRTIPTPSIEHHSNNSSSSIEQNANICNPEQVECKIPSQQSHDASNAHEEMPLEDEAHDDRRARTGLKAMIARHARARVLEATRSALLRRNEINQTSGAQNRSVKCSDDQLISHAMDQRISFAFCALRERSELDGIAHIPFEVVVVWSPWSLHSSYEAQSGELTCFSENYLLWNLSSKRIVLTSSDSCLDLTRKHFAESSLGKLEAFFDFSDSFHRHLPCIRKWLEILPVDYVLLYYAVLHDEHSMRAISMSRDDSGAIAPICWYQLRLRGRCDDCGIGEGVLLRLHIQSHHSRYFVWERSHPQPLRVVLAYAHILQNEGVLSGGFVHVSTASMIRRIPEFCMKTQHWAVEDRHGGVNGTIDWMMRILAGSTARRWETSGVQVESTLCDWEDEVMDTLLLWTYPFPRAIIFFICDLSMVTKKLLDAFVECSSAEDALR
jgi:hypothetical protein